MIETTLPGAGPIAPSVKPSPHSVPAPAQKAEPTNPDGSAIPDIIAYHHRPEDLGDHSNQDVDADGGSGGKLFGEDGLTFGDVLDVINPLQHIPVVSHFYREITGDEISPAARVAGGALFGGPIGLAVATVNAVVEATTGNDIGEAIATAFAGDGTEPETKQAKAVPQTGRAISIAEADPAIVGVGTRSIGLISPQPADLAAISSGFAGANGLNPTTGKLPFGGVGAFPFSKAQAASNDPVAALLQARAAVPLTGSVPGIGNHNVPSNAKSPALPQINTRLADKLSALAAQSAPVKAASQSDGKVEAKHAGSVLPTQVPQHMTDTLERYERMKNAQIPGR